MFQVRFDSLIFVTIFVCKYSFIELFKLFSLTDLSTKLKIGRKKNKH